MCCHRPEPTADSTQAALASGSNLAIEFDSPLLMLVEIHKDRLSSGRNVVVVVVVVR